MDSPQSTAHASPTHCQHCGGSCISQQITLTLPRSHGFALVRNVPADVCQNCGESQFTLYTTREIMMALQTDRPPDDIAIIPIYDFAARP